MKGTNIRLNELFGKYFEDNISESELVEFSGYVDDPMFSHEIQTLLGDAFKEGDQVLSLGERGRSRVLNNILGYEVLKEKPKRAVLWSRLVGIAATIAIVGFGLYFIRYHNEYAQGGNLTNTIKPGRSAATLTLANGKKIVLSDVATGTVAKESGVTVTKTATGQIIYNITGDAAANSNQQNTLSTEKGETYILTLPDKTKISLNAASTVEYPANFAKLRERKVRLTGEAYFEVAKDKRHPFIVETSSQTIQVLGTHFNVYAYTDEKITKTTLLEGSVEVSNLKGKKAALKPGEQSIISGSAINISKVNTDLAIAWKNNEFMFEHESVENIMKILARWYDVEVIYDVEKPTRTISGSVSRFDNVSKVLQIIESTGQVHFRIEGQKIYVQK